MLARANSSLASVERVKPIAITAADRMRLIRQYIVRRLREEVRGRHGAQARLAREFGMTSAHLSNVLADNPTREPGEEFAHKAAAHWGMTYAELEEAACGPRRRHDGQSPVATADPPISTFLMQLDRMPGLRKWVEDTRSGLTVSQIAAGIAVYDAAAVPKSTSTGIPLAGWEGFFRDVAAGKFEGPRKTGDQEAAEAIEIAQLPAATRKRLLPPSRK